MATCAAEAEEMVEAARRAGKLLMVGFVRRYEKGSALLRQLVSQDFFGELYYAKLPICAATATPADGLATSPAPRAVR